MALLLAQLLRTAMESTQVPPAAEANPYDPFDRSKPGSFWKQLGAAGFQLLMLRVQYVALASASTGDIFLTSRPGLPEICLGLFDIGWWSLLVWAYNALGAAMNLILLALDMPGKHLRYLRLLSVGPQMVITIIGCCRVVEAWGNPGTAQCGCLFEVFWWLFLGIFLVILGGLALGLLLLLLLKAFRPGR